MMECDNKNILSLLDHIKINKFYVVCYFKCNTKGKTIVSTVPFEPYEGKIEITLKDMILHPIDSYNKYYHTPITIFSNDCKDTIVLKAFEKVSKHFKWNAKEQMYIYMD